MRLSKERRKKLKKFAEHGFADSHHWAMDDITTEELLQLGPKTKLRLLQKIYDNFVCRFDDGNRVNMCNLSLLHDFTSYFVWPNGHLNFSGLGIISYSKMSELLFPLIIKGNQEALDWIERYKKTWIGIEYCIKYFKEKIKEIKT